VLLSTGDIIIIIIIIIIAFVLWHSELSRLC